MHLDRVLTWTRLTKQIAEAVDWQALRAARDQMSAAAARWQERGMPPSEILAAVNRWHTLLMQRVMELTLIDLKTSAGEPPVPFCWFLLGSGGRQESALQTDQDHALVYAETEDVGFFQALAERVVQQLEAVGYPQCQGFVMATNPRWNLPLSEWEQQIDSYLAFPNWDNVRFLNFLGDMRPVFGDQGLFSCLQDYYLKRMRHASFLHWQSAEHNVERPVGIDFFHKFRLEQWGEHEGQVHLKEGGYLQLVEAARLFALANGVRATATSERIRQLKELQVWPVPFADEVEQALHVFCRHRLRGNHVRPSDLSADDAASLKRAMKTTRHLQKRAARHFRRPHHIGERGEA